MACLNPNASEFVPGATQGGGARRGQTDFGTSSGSRSTAVDGSIHRGMAQVDDTVINTFEGLHVAVARLSRERLLCVDTEGCDLSKGSWRNGRRVEDPAVPLHGQLCLLQISTAGGEAFAIDILEMGREAFSHGLGKLLESLEIIKIVHDFRQDEDALWHQFGVRVRAKFDCQLADVLIRRLQGHRTAYVQGSAKLFSTYNIELGVLPGYGEVTQEQKLRIHERFSADRHLWAKRPLPSDMVKYAKFDVLPLAQLYHTQVMKLTDMVHDTDMAMNMVLDGSEFYDAAFRELQDCRCRLCCAAEANARFDGHLVFPRMANKGWRVHLIWRPEDSVPLTPPGPSRYYINENDQSVLREQD